MTGSKTLGTRLRELRETAGWSQEELGLRLGNALQKTAVAGATISRYETGERMPQVSIIRAMETLFKLERNALIEYL